MKVHRAHSLNLTPAAAIALQRRLAGTVDAATPLRHCETVAGADISYNRFSSTLYAGVVVLRTSDWSIIETRQVVAEATFPYRTGLLTFREAPAVLEAFEQVECEPDAVIVDGAGVAHPRRFGLAAYIGVCLNRPTVGCAKSRLIGTFAEPAREANSTSPLMDHDEVIGSVVRPKTGVKPLFVSVGHRIDLASAVRLVLDACCGYRVPEPTRQAHLLVNAMRREAQNVSSPSGNSHCKME